MGKINLNFIQNTGRHNPPKQEIHEVEGLAFSVEAIIKTLYAYANANDDKADIGSVCMYVCYALELLMDPITEYLSNYAGDVPTPE
jgi:hypothetical protein